MLSSSLWWAILGVAVFWAVGAYNRLVRLRAAAIHAFGGLDAHLLRLLVLVGEYGVAQASAGAADTDQGQALQAAVTQFSASLAQARAHPLQADAAAALHAAQQVLDAAWAAATALGTVPETVPAGSDRVSWAARREQHARPRALATEQFNTAVVQYNAAINQFPAQLLAAVFGFKNARTL